MGRSLPAIINELGADPYAADDVSSALLQAESIMKSNNARVAVDWKGPVDMLNLADASLTQLLEDVRTHFSATLACMPSVVLQELGQDKLCLLWHLFRAHLKGLSLEQKMLDCGLGLFSQGSTLRCQDFCYIR